MNRHQAISIRIQFILWLQSICKWFIYQYLNAVEDFYFHLPLHLLMTLKVAVHGQVKPLYQLVFGPPDWKILARSGASGHYFPAGVGKHWIWDWWTSISAILVCRVCISLWRDSIWLETVWGSSRSRRLSTQVPSFSMTVAQLKITKNRN